MKFKNEEELVMFFNGILRKQFFKSKLTAFELVEILLEIESTQIAHQAPRLSNEVATQR